MAAGRRPTWILGSLSLLFGIGTVSEEVTIVWGALGHDINLDIPGFQMAYYINDIRWLRKEDKTKVAQFRSGTIIKTPNYDMFPNGTLKIKNLLKNSNSIYEVEVYHKNGKHIRNHTIDLRILDNSRHRLCIITASIFILCIVCLLYKVGLLRKPDRTNSS